jgi:hypothetical protein
VSDAPLTLGPVTFKSFEIPSKINFGGRQRLSIHTLSGGNRVIDALGPEDSDIQFSGILSGSDAVQRALLLDAFRSAGLVITLTWDILYYSVVIREFSAMFENEFWIRYSVCCTVLSNIAVCNQCPVQSLSQSIFSDIQAVANLAPTVEVSWPVVQQVLADPNSSICGTTQYSDAIATTTAALASVSSELQVADELIGGFTMTDNAGASGTADTLFGTVMANLEAWKLAVAGGYLGRIHTNLLNASS